MNVGSLFSGIGGIELGFEAEGFRTEWFVEYDSYCQAVLKTHWPNTLIYGDITKIDFNTVPKVDILTGGFPCQDISNAGKRVGITGSRSSLWKYYLEAIRILRPRYAVIENVSALAGRGLDVVLADLAEVGYDAEWYNISASSVGAPHMRERLFIIAYPNSSRYVYRESDEQSTKTREQTQCELVSSSTHVENTNCDRIGARTWEDDLRGSEDEESTGELVERSQGYRGQWTTEPGLGRVADGVSNRVDRIKCLGNAVVPQVAQVIARAIKEYENKPPLENGQVIVKGEVT